MAVATNQMGEIVQIDKYANSVGTWLEGNQRKLEALLPRQIRADRFIRLVVGAIRRVPRLSLCSKESLIDAMLEAAALGLDLDTALGHCYVLPYKNHGQYEATFILGYKGLNSLMYRSGLVKSARAFEVFERDIFEIDDGASNPITHKRCLTGDPGKLIGFASRIETSTGGIVADFMSVAQVEAIRKRARAGDSGPWVTDFNEMGKKTVLKRNAKYAPMSSEAARAVALDEAADANLPQSFSMSLETSAPRELPEPQVEPMPHEVTDVEAREVPQPVAAAQPAHVDAQPTIPPRTVESEGGKVRVNIPAQAAPSPTGKPTTDWQIPAGKGQKKRMSECSADHLDDFAAYSQGQIDAGKTADKYIESNKKQIALAREWAAWMRSQAKPAEDSPPAENEPPEGEQSSFDSAF